MNFWHKLQHVSEETQPIFYTPIFMGNECIIVAFQSQRCLNDNTILNFSRLTANGELVPMEYFTNDPAFYEYAVNELRAKLMQNTNSALLTPTTSLPELRMRLMQAQRQHLMHMAQYPYKEQAQRHSDVDMWDTTKHAFHATKSTSTTELTTQNIATPLCRNCSKIYVDKSPTSCFSRGCNTENFEAIHLNNQKSPIKKLNVFEQRKLRRRLQNII